MPRIKEIEKDCIHVVKPGTFVSIRRHRGCLISADGDFGTKCSVARGPSAYTTSPAAAGPLHHFLRAAAASHWPAGPADQRLASAR